MKIIDVIAAILLLFGGLNWGLIGVADFNVIMWVFIAMSNVQHLLYICMGLAALWVIIQHKGIRRRWAKK
jgi:uncharacterized membrane protein YuzA (DUF378 family)